MSASKDLDSRVTTVLLIAVVAIILFGGWWIWFRKPPQKLPPGVTDPARLTEDFYAGRYRPGVGYVTPPPTPAAPPAAGAPPVPTAAGAPPR